MSYAAPCAHEPRHQTRRGSNQYVRRITCSKCKKVLFEWYTQDAAPELVREIFRSVRIDIAGDEQRDRRRLRIPEDGEEHPEGQSRGSRISRGASGDPVEAPPHADSMPQRVGDPRMPRRALGLLSRISCLCRARLR